ncbi:hypothetical protein B5C26_02700 [Photorhabdus luminescens]|uniref:ORF6N domain-containing protein n=1 Tax=Photorhabdus TaxID=29487 RepID=UPI000B4D3E48|nr:MULTISPECIES: ORF6N domain-containing protein [Photorhabdus]MCW7549183.1 ORF6N domain-containing protein [Photorhabdus aballayi]OWO84598.1 hypothetical protein B5C26_02700 [Photorhabdus luminescens]
MTSIAINKTHNTINAENLHIITYNSIPVITTELLAQLYGTETNNIKVNFNRNADRFICGKHYFKLEASELKEFKNKVTQSNLVAPRAKHLILWTERGAARHAKMLDTDNAWDVFEKLEDCYFNRAGFNGKILLTIENGEVTDSMSLSSKHHVATLDEFFKIARHARYFLIHEDAAAPMLKALRSWDSQAPHQ